MGNICNVIPLQEPNIDDKANAKALCVDLSGNPIIFEADSAIAQKLSVDIEPIQDLHGYDKPWVGGAGKNKIDASDTTTSGAEYFINKVIDRLNAGDYVLSFDCTVSENAQCQFSVKDGTTTVGTKTVSISSGNSRVTMKITASTSFSVAVAYITKASTIKNIQLESGSQATAYEPYSNICPISGRTETEVTTRNADNTESHTASLSFGQTVYGGHVDFKTGKVTVTHGIVDLSTLTWTKNTSTSLTVGYYFQGTGISNKNQTAIDNKCSSYENIPYTSIASAVSALGAGIDHVTLNAGGNNVVRVIDSTYTTAEDFADSLSGVQYCYKLNTPTEFTLTPSELQLLKGYNYITADGNINISLVPENVIDYVMGQIISAMGTNESGRTTASRAYSAKEYFYKDGKMYKCLTSIASGATFTVGTNCAETSIFAELTALNA